ncbi:MAG: IS66 family insertion sequence element accessory protein TnpA [Bacteroidota bacterium]
MGLQENREKMMHLVSSWRESGQTQKDFASEKRLSLSKFRYWVSKSKKERNEISPFIQLAPSANQEIQVHFPNGVELHLPPGIPLQEIKNLIGWRQ